MKNMLRGILLLVLLKLSVFAATDYVILVDYSLSISKEDQQLYKETVGSILGDMKNGDRISLVNVGQSDLSNFKSFEHFTMKKGFTNRVKIHNIKGLKHLWRNFLNKPFETEKATNIISAIRGSTQIFNMSERDNKSLIILSDMVDSSRESKAHDFAKNVHCNIIQRTVNKIDKPSLDGIKVYVVGAGGLGDKGYYCLKKFWHEFFIQSGVKDNDLVYQRINPFE